MRTRHARRHGLTLVEMLVVITIVAVLFAIVVVVGPRFDERQRVTRGASQLQGWLLVAKQRALRDGAPRGLRLLPVLGPPHAQYVTQLQYIEQPEPYQPVGALLLIQPPNFNEVRIRFPDVPALRDQVMQVLWPLADRQANILPDLVLEFYGRYPGQPRRVLNIDDRGGQLLLMLDQPFEQPLPGAPPTDTIRSTEFRFYRRAQPIAGEPLLEMPRDIGIDISRDGNPNGPSWYRMFPPTGNALAPQPYDILFDSAGQVIGPAGRMSNRLCLWVRDVTLNTPGPNVGNDPGATDPTVLPPGANTLITIYTRTGLIAAHPVADRHPQTGVSLLQPGPNWNPFRFTQDGRSSGI